ncbi:MAG: dihydrolipoamide acetyltransferase [Roseiflexaceae bacterium]
MAITILLPKLGNSVESSIIVRWMKAIGEAVAIGESICEVETDKTTVEVPSSASGILLRQLAAVGDDIPVQQPIAIIGEPGEPIDLPSIGEERLVDRPIVAENCAAQWGSAPGSAPALAGNPQPISPRARRLAQQHGLDTSQLSGSGPHGRIIERDVQAALAARPKLTPVARAMVERGGYTPPESGSGPGGRVTARDLRASTAPAPAAAEPLAAPPSDTTTTPLAGIRRTIAERMRASLQQSAQLTLHSSADARVLREYRARLKQSPEALGMRGITINDLVMFAVARTLPQHLGLNATLSNNSITSYQHIHLGMAVDTPRGLLVPVIRNADTLSLRTLAHEAARLAAACQAGKISPDELQGGSFTITNLGGFGIAQFTPILNTPQVAILGVGGIDLKPTEQADGSVAFIPHLALSLTIDHQVVDGAPAARFLQDLAHTITALDIVVGT